MLREVYLCRAVDFEAAWDAVAHPWLTRANAGAWRGAGPCSVLVPSFAYAQFLRSEIAAAGEHLLNLRFLTPVQCWDMLHEQLCPDVTVPDRDDLHLLLSAAAEQFPTVPPARSVAREPGLLMRALDQVAAAGWTDDSLGLHALAGTLESFRTHLRRAGMATAQEAERRFGELAAGLTPIFESLLVIGFDGRHWPLWNLLRAAVTAAASATVCLFEPRPTAETPDQIWISSWEAAFGEAGLLPDTASPSPLAGLAEAVETGRTFTTDRLALHVGQDASEQARAVVLQAARFLAEPSCSRLGILFSGAGVLASQTAWLLDRLGVPHHDSFGQCAPPDPAGRAWQSWLDMARQPGLAALNAFVEACPEAPGLLGLEADRLLKGLRSAYDELMVDDPLVLAAHRKWPLAQEWPWLPERATFAEFADATRRAMQRFAGLGPPERVAAFEARARAFAPRWRATFSRDVYLAWLAAVTRDARRVTAAHGSHPYARVHLLAYDQAEWQRWSHLILAGLNRNHWPPEPRDPPFLHQSLVDRLNRRSVATGPQGEGQQVAKPGFGWIIGPAERGGQARRQFLNLLECVREGACLAAARTQDADPSVACAPSDLLTRVALAAYGEGLSEEKLEAIRKATSAWIEQSPHLDAEQIQPGADVSRTAEAHRARNDPEKPFGPYDYALSTPPAKPLTLSCTAWERAFRWPAVAWLEAVLGVADETWDPDELPWDRVVGLWVHDWLRRAIGRTAEGGAPEPLPPIDRIRERLQRAAAQVRADAERSFAAAGRHMPSWWRAVHAQAAAMCAQLADALADAVAEGWQRGTAEWTLPEPVQAVLPGGRRLRLRGRVDLLLARGENGPHRLIDYKTGSTPTLRPADVAKGLGLQILLYGIALDACGMKQAGVSAIRPGAVLEPPVDPARLLGHPPVAAALDCLGKMQDTGVFGMKGNTREEFTFSLTYPLAQLAVPAEVLTKKRELTFG